MHIGYRVDSYSSSLRVILGIEQGENDGRLT